MEQALNLKNPNIADLNETLNVELEQLFNDIKRLPPAPPQVIDQARRDAEERILASLKMPVYDDYVRRAGQPPEEPVKSKNWQLLFDIRKYTNPFDWLIPIFFVALLLVSLTHMLSFTGLLASTIYENAPDSFRGIWLDLFTHTIVHQVMLYAVSELGILFLFSRWRLLRYLGHKNFMTDLNLVFAFMCAGIVIYANIRSMLHPLVAGVETNFTTLDFVVSAAIGFIVPALTMYLGERPAELIFTAMQEQQRAKREYEKQLIEYNRRREQAIVKYQQDSDDYNNAMLHPRKHPDYEQAFASALVRRFKQSSASRNLDLDWTSSHEEMFAAREIARLSSTEGLRQKIAFFTSMFQQPTLLPATYQGSDLPKNPQSVEIKIPPKN